LRRHLDAAAALLAAALLCGGAGDAGRGRELAEARSCGACHGDRGIAAQPYIPSLAGQPDEFTTLQLILFREQLRSGPPMPDLAQGLSDGEIEDLAAYFSSLPPGPPPQRRPRNPRQFQAGAELSERLRCGICHLPDYRGQAQIPRLAGQREEYLVKSLTGYRDGTRRGTDTNMNAVMYGVTDAEILALAHYMAQR
jgi:cytochrome c553